MSKVISLIKTSVMGSLGPSEGQITPVQQMLASGSGALITSFLGGYPNLSIAFIQGSKTFLKIILKNCFVH